MNKSGEDFLKSLDNLVKFYTLKLPSTHQTLHVFEDILVYGPIFIWWGKVFEHFI